MPSTPCGKAKGLEKFLTFVRALLPSCACRAVRGDKCRLLPFQNRRHRRHAEKFYPAEPNGLLAPSHGSESFPHRSSNHRADIRVNAARGFFLSLQMCATTGLSACEVEEPRRRRSWRSIPAPEQQEWWAWIPRPGENGTIPEGEHNEPSAPECPRNREQSGRSRRPV